MVKFDEKESLNPKISDFEFYGKVIMFNMFVWFYYSFAYFWSQFLSDFDVRPLKLKLMTSSTKVIRHLIMVKMCPKIAKIGYASWRGYSRL